MNRRLRRGAVLAVTALAALAVSAGPAAATAAPTQWHLGYRFSFSTVQFWRGALWAVRTDEAQSALVTRIDAGTGAATTVADLRFGAGGFAVGYGSLWISDWYGNAVWRVAPDGTVQARIPTGSGPQYVALAFGSVWVSNHHGHSVTRIDPGSDGVVATVTAGDPTRFRNGPSCIAPAPDRMWVMNDNQDVIQQIDPVSNRPHDVSIQPDTGCTVAIIAAAGLMWIPDGPDGILYGHRPDGSIASQIHYPGTGGPTTATVLGGSLWVGADRAFDAGSRGVLEQRDPATGRLDRTIAVGGDVSGLVAGAGSLWELDNGPGLIRRVDPGTP